MALDPTLTAYIGSPEIPTDVRKYAANLGRGSMYEAGNPGQLGQPMGPGLVGQPQVGGAPGVLAAPPVANPQAAMMQGAQPVGAVPAGGPAGVQDMSMQIAMQLMNMDPYQALMIIGQIPDPSVQQQMIQITAMLNPNFAAMIQGGMGQAAAPIQQPAGAMPAEEAGPLAGMTPDELLAMGGGVMPVG